MANSRILTRLEALERLRNPKEYPVLNLIFESDDIADLPEKIEYCDRHNHPESGLYHSVVWIGEENATAAAMLAGKFDTVNRKTIVVKRAEKDAAI